MRPREHQSSLLNDEDRERAGIRDELGYERAYGTFGGGMLKHCFRDPAGGGGARGGAHEHLFTHVSPLQASTMSIERGRGFSLPTRVDERHRLHNIRR